MLKGEPFFAMARPSFFVEFLFQPFRITGRCLTFFPICRCSSAKTISGVRSKNPMPFFPAHPAAAVLQTDELLFHLPPTVWTDFVARAHCFSPVLQSNVLNDKLEFMSMQTQSHQAHCLSYFFCLFSQNPFADKASRHLCYFLKSTVLEFLCIDLLQIAKVLFHIPYSVCQEGYKGLQLNCQ